MVGYPHEVKGEGIYSFVVLKENANFEADLVASELKSIVRKKLTGYAAPDIVQVFIEKRREITRATTQTQKQTHTIKPNIKILTIKNNY